MLGVDLSIGVLHLFDPLNVHLVGDTQRLYNLRPRGCPSPVVVKHRRHHVVFEVALKLREVAGELARLSALAPKEMATIPPYRGKAPEVILAGLRPHVFREPLEPLESVGVSPPRGCCGCGESLREAQP